jgi:hypothetical protein
MMLKRSGNTKTKKQLFGEDMSIKLINLSIDNLSTLFIAFRPSTGCAEVIHVFVHSLNIFSLLGHVWRQSMEIHDTRDAKTKDLSRLFAEDDEFSTQRHSSSTSSSHGSLGSHGSNVSHGTHGSSLGTRQPSQKRKEAPFETFAKELRNYPVRRTDWTIRTEQDDYVERLGNSLSNPNHIPASCTHNLGPSTSGI